MRTLEMTQAALVARRALAPVPLVVVTAYSDREAETVATTLYLSDRPVLYDYGNAGTPRAFSPWLASIDPLRRSMALVPQPVASGGDGPLAGTLRLTLTNATLSDGSRVWAYLRGLNLLRARVEVATVLVDPATLGAPCDLRALAGDEHVVWYRGQLVRVEGVDDAAIQLRCETELPRLPWLYALDAETTDPLDRGARLPVVIGRCRNVPCVSWAVGWVTTLAQSLTAGQTGVVAVTDASGFPLTTFDVRIGDERVTCSTSDHTANTITVTARGVGSTFASSYSAGVAVLEVVSEVVLAVAGHGTSNVSALRVRNPYNDELWTVTTGYTSDTADTTLISGETVTTVRIGASDLAALLASAFTSAAVTEQPTLPTSPTQTTTDYAPDGAALTPSTSTYSRAQAVAASANEIYHVLHSGDVPRRAALLTWGATNLTPGTDEVQTYQLAFTFVASLKSSGRFGHTSRVRAYRFPGIPSGNDIFVLDPVGSQSTSVTYPSSGVITPAPGTTLADFIGAYLEVDLVKPPNDGTSHTGDTVKIVGPVVRVINYTTPPDDLTEVAIKGATVGYGLRFFADVNGPLVPTVAETDESAAADAPIRLSDDGTREWRSGSFTSAASHDVDEITIYARKFGDWTRDLSVSLRSDSSGVPGSALGSFADIDAADVPQHTFSALRSEAISAPSITAATRYHVAVTAGDQPLTSVVLDACEVTTGWTGENATLLATAGDALRYSCASDSANWRSSNSSTFADETKAGTPSLKITGAAAQTEISAMRATAFSAEDWTGKRVRFSLYVGASDLSAMTELYVMFSSDDFASTYRFCPIDVDSLTADAWNTITVNLERYSAQSGFSVSSINNLRVNATFSPSASGRVMWLADINREGERDVGSGAIRMVGTGDDFAMYRTDLAGVIDFTGKVVRLRAWWERGALRGETEWYDAVIDNVPLLVLGDTAANPTVNYRVARPVEIGALPAGEWHELTYDLTDTTVVGTGANFGSIDALKIVASNNGSGRTLYIDDLRVLQPFVELDAATDGGAESVASAADSSGSPGAWTATSGTQLRLVVAEDAAYSGASGSVIEGPSDALRWLLAEHAGLGHTALDTASFDAVASDVGGAHAIVAHGLGMALDEVASRIAYEARAHLVADEGATGATFRLVAAGSAAGGWLYASPVRTLTHVISVSEAGRDLGEVATDWRAFYARDNAAETDDERSFTRVARADADVNDTALAGSEFTDAAERFGRTASTPLALRTIDDEATAEERLGYFAREGLREGARLLILRVPWWEAYDLQLGDVVTVTDPWAAPATFDAMVIEYEKDWLTEAITLRVVEVPT